MGYSTLTDLLKSVKETTLVQLCSDNGEATIASVEVIEVVNEAIESADAEIDSYLLTKWNGLRDLDPVPPLVNRISCVLASAWLYQRRGRLMTSLGDEVARWRDWLRAVNRGDVTLPTDSAGSTLDSQYERWLTDAETEDDDDLPDNDQRNFTPSKLTNLTGV